MLETVREFARDRLNASEERDALLRRHAGFFLALAEASAPLLVGSRQVEELDRLDREHDNLRAVVQWAVRENEREIASRLGAALWFFWRRRGYLTEGRSQIERILALAPEAAASTERCSILTGAGALALFQGDYDQAMRKSEEALACWRQVDGYQGIGRSLLCQAIVARFRDDYPTAQSLGLESLKAFRQIDDRWGIGRVLGHLGMIAWVQGDHATGTAYYEEALTYLRQVGDGVGIFEVVIEMGKGACDEGDLARATTLFDECLALCSAMGNRAGSGATLTELGVVARLQGDPACARDLLLQATTLAQANGDRRQTAYLAAHLGEVDVAIGDVGSAAARFAEALGHFLEMRNRVGIAQCLEAIARCAAQRGHDLPAIRLLGSATALFAAIGATPPPDRDPAIVTAALAARSDPAAFSEAWEAGQALSPDAAAAEALALAVQLADEDAPETMSVATSETGRTSPAMALGLTPREIDVLALLGEGLSDREIADRLSISERTAGNHVQHAMQKIGVSSRTAAAVYAVRNGLL